MGRINKDMTIIVHDGSEGCEYNSYASINDANAYHEARVTPSWIDDDDIVSAALIRATDYIDAHYDLAPIVGAVPAALVRATIVLAVFAISDTLVRKVDRDVVETEEELSGVGKLRTKFDEQAVSDPYPTVTRILAPLTAGAGSFYVGRLVK